MGKKEIADDQAHDRTVSLLRSLISKTGDLDQESKKTDVNEHGGGQGNNENPEELLQAVADLAMGRVGPARQVLARILKAAPKNSAAWLWFSRTSENLKTINIALNNASAISPDNREIAEERQKVKSAVSSGCKEASQLEHCFYCWAPVLAGHATCHYCNSHLDIHEDFFHSKFFDDSNKSIHQKIILDAFQRFSKSSRLEPRNALLHFRLAMTHINMDQWDEALDELLLAKSINPLNNLYEEQLGILSDFMDDLGTFFTEENQTEKDLVATGKHGAVGKRILVVEDSKTTRTVIRKMLNQEGYKVIEAEDGLDALDKYEKNTPDLILLDIIMPGLNGYQTLSALKKSHNLDDTPVILLSAKGNLINKMKGKMAGSAEYLTKPFNALELMKVVKHHLTN